MFGDLGFMLTAYAGKVFEFGFEWGFWGFAHAPSGLDYLPRYFNLSHCF